MTRLEDVIRGGLVILAALLATASAAAASGTEPPQAGGNAEPAHVANATVQGNAPEPDAGRLAGPGHTVFVPEPPAPPDAAAGSPLVSLGYGLLAFTVLAAPLLLRLQRAAWDDPLDPRYGARSPASVGAVAGSPSD